MDPLFNFVYKNYPAIIIVSVMSAIMLKYVWVSKRISKNLGTKAIFLTNCESLIGWETARKLDKLGFYVFAGFVETNSDAAQRLRSRTSSRLTVVEVDVKDEQSISDAILCVRNDLKDSGLYALVNDCMMFLEGEFDWYTLQQCQDMLDINLSGTIRVIKHFLPLLKQGKGRIINVSSIYGRYPHRNMSIFSSTNAALDKFFECLAYEMEDLDIKISLIEERIISANGQCNYAQEIEKMWENMTEDNRQLYSHKFGEFKKKYQRETKSSIKFSKEHTKVLLNAIEESILSEDPQFHYRVLPHAFKTRIMMLLDLLPYCLKYKLVRLLFYSNSKPVNLK